jgi:hypothetical protein
MDDSTWKTLAKASTVLREIEEQFAKIQENPALYGAENGFNAERLELLDQVTTQCGVVNIAGKEIARRAMAQSKKPNGGGL